MEEVTKGPAQGGETIAGLERAASVVATVTASDGRGGTATSTVTLTVVAQRNNFV